MYVLEIVPEFRFVLLNILDVVFSSEGYAFPETLYLGAKRARKVVASVLRDACDDGDLKISEAAEAAQDIFKNIAIRLYKLPELVESSFSNNFTPHDSKTLKASVPEQGILFVQVIFVDGSGQHRCRVIPCKCFYDVARHNGVGLTFAIMGMTSFSVGPADGTNLTGTGKIRLMPDLSTKRTLPWSRQDEMVLADMELKPGEAWEYCLRQTLGRASKVLKDEFNLEMNAGFKNEFCLSRKVNAALQSINITVEQLKHIHMHAESGKGQFEIFTPHAVCTSAADNLVYAREVIRAVARKHGLLATFLPKYALNDIGSECHVHLSLSQNGSNVFMGSDDGSSRYGMSKIAEEFMAGVFGHLSSVLAFVSPLPNSYDRIQLITWSGAFHCWGTENREAPFRTACPPGIADGLVSNFELKSFDGCANPHLGLASLIASGIDGLRRHLSLPEGPEPILTNPASVEGLQRLPKDLGESVEALEKDAFLKEFIGEKMVTAIIGVRKAEIDYHSKNKDAYKELIHKY
ncbi:hypothetical protein MKX01_032034 [Papaver californicum]|nr:hypothetical protein MKX01_032034 [Papaver californicum]